MLERFEVNFSTLPSTVRRIGLCSKAEFDLAYVANDLATIPFEFWGHIETPVPLNTTRNQIQYFRQLYLRQHIGPIGCRQSQMPWQVLQKNNT